MPRHGDVGKRGQAEWESRFYHALSPWGNAFSFIYRTQELNCPPIILVQAREWISNVTEHIFHSCQSVLIVWNAWLHTESSATFLACFLQTYFISINSWIPGLLTAPIPQISTTTPLPGWTVLDVKTRKRTLIYYSCPSATNYSTSPYTGVSAKWRKSKLRMRRNRG